MAVELDSITQLQPVAGVKLATCAAGIRYADRSDLVLISLDKASTTALVQTQNRFSAAPVQIAARHFNIAKPLALVINAGNANAGTGQKGVDDALECCALVAAALDLLPEQVLPFSTGVIGEHLPIDRFRDAVPTLAKGLDRHHWVEAANAIMTTDTVAKGESVQVKIDGQLVTLTGIVKGSGMIHPDMATMLAFIATDAPIAQPLLQQSLELAVDRSLNCITVDGDTSTNDACSLIATGKCDISPIVDNRDPRYKKFQFALRDLISTLAKNVVRDAEGATKFVEINVSGADYDACKSVANTIALSPLVKTAIFASDPNWGRILAAVGRAPISSDQIDMHEVSIIINDVSIVQAGELVSDYHEADGQAAFNCTNLKIDVRVASGNKLATVWTSDLSHDYISINADYRS
ncbi:MAG TPA: bifunctional ornithine acetyltransferase/N-acetylglutamate synthase [Gammaproteobacteria bacterium]|jgi:glutamate N-acetyltransferase / amino-acid N-acetyltransferase|nr:bifunctional ornithine acetyltransferase/N-acetylglutamate synthase [Gammaproteobacteria bacterium]